MTCALWHGTLLCWKKDIIRWVNCGHEVMHMINSNTEIILSNQRDTKAGTIDVTAINTIGVKGKHSPHHYSPATSLNCWHEVGWIHESMLLVRILSNHLYVVAEIKIPQTRQCFSGFHLSSFCLTVQHVVPSKMLFCSVWLLFELL